MTLVLFTGTTMLSMYTDTKTQSMEGASRGIGQQGATGSVKAQDRTGEDGRHVALEQQGHAVKAKQSHPKFVLPARDQKAGLVSIVLGNRKLVLG